MECVDTVTGIRDEGAAVVLQLAAVPAVELDGAPGWLTGRPLRDQGVETTMPNLPDLELPQVVSRGFELRIAFPAPDTVRITLAPTGHPALADDGTGLGIVTTPAPSPVSPTVTDDGRTVEVSGGRARVRLQRYPFALQVVDAEQGTSVLRTAERLRQVAGFPVAPSVLARADATTVNLELGTDEDVLGFGEQFGRLVKNGQRLVLRVEDALGTGTGMTYKPVPVWHSSRGYTGFLNTGAVVTADVGHRRPSVFGLSVADEAVDLYVVLGADPARRLASYTALTGRAQVPPVWAFGSWMGRCRYHSAEEMLDVADCSRQHRVPLDVLHLDPDWLVTDRLNCDFIWNETRFGNRRAFVQALAERGVRLSLWELPYLDPASPRYAEAEARGYLLRDAAGHVAPVAGTPSPDGRPRALLDFTDADARAWWQSLHEPFLDDGVAVFKTDFGEGVPEVAVAWDGTPAGQLHNLYPLRYNGAVSEVVARRTGRNALVWGRSGWAGSHRYPGQWGGDAESTVAGMQATVRGGLSYAMSAPGLWSHDIGGFFGPELTPALYVRWTQLGALSPLMRAHGLRPREPWAFGTRALEIAREWTRLRYRLLPYLWQVAHEAASAGQPMMRPLALAYPDDPVARSADDVFLLGRDLLVVPIFDDGEQPVHRRWWVPRGRWTDLHTGRVVEGPGFTEDVVPLDRMPVLVRDGARVPMVEVDESVRCTDDVLDRPWTLHTWGRPTGGHELIGFDGGAPVIAGEVRHGG